MGLHFVLGAAKSGKTTFVYDTIIEMADRKPEEGFLFVVPEQATLSVEQDIVKRHSRHVLFNMDVLSLTRLAYRVLEELCIKTPEVIDDLGRIMLVRQALINVDDKLTAFKGMTEKSGFVEKIKNTLTELMQYSIDTAVLQGLTEDIKGRPQLKNKVHDICVIAQEFYRLLGDRLITSEKILIMLNENIRNSESLKNSTVVLDGFGSFTTLQYSIIEQMLGACRDVYVVLNMDRASVGRELRDNDLFAASFEMRSEIARLAQNMGVEIKDDIVMDEDVCLYENRELFELRNHFDMMDRAESVEGADNIYLSEASNPGEEIDLIAGQIIDLTRTENYRYNDIAIAVTQSEIYAPIIERVFTGANIPVFMDDRHSLSTTTPIRAIIAALNVINSGYTTDSVIAYLRSGVTEELGFVDSIENYARAFGIRGRRRFSEQWTKTNRLFNEASLENINYNREVLLKPVLELDKNLKDKKTVANYIEALKTFTEDIEIREICDLRVEFLTENGLSSTAQEYTQVCDEIDRVFEQIATILGNAKISIAVFSQILEEGLNSLQVGVIPQTLDRVVICDFVRSRMGDKKAVFVVGMNDGVFPMQKSQDEIFNDTDRDVLEGLNIKLAHSSKRENFNYKQCLYRMFTKPTQRLYMSYSGQSEEGKNQKISYVAEQVKGVFGILNSARVSDNIYSARQGLMCLARDVVTDEKTKSALTQFYREQEEYAPILDKIKTGRELGCVVLDLDPAKCRELFTSNGQISVTRLELLASCQMAFFLRYGLGIEPREEFELLRQDIGIIYHRAFELIIDELMEKKKDYAGLSEADKDELASDNLEKALKEKAENLFEDSERNRYLRQKMKEVLRLNLDAVISHIVRGTFVPVKAEMAFGRNGEKPMELPETDITLEGKIDRVDVSEADGAVRIIDYKTGFKSFDFKDLNNGLSLQLMLYLSEIAKKYSDKLRGGGLYFHVSNPMPEISASDLQDKSEEEIKQLIYDRKMDELRMDGVMNRDGLKAFEKDLGCSEKSKVIKSMSLTKDGSINGKGTKNVYFNNEVEAYCKLALNKSKELVDIMLSGRIETNPYSDGDKNSCKYCDFKSICGFDETIKGFKYRKLDGLDRKDYKQYLDDLAKDIGGDSGEVD
ncbi:MAG: exodeoxyribonuclease V subunit gamma [Lachnospiraceae bacterium]|nr:exodeoxyribonuclease V subunit gamma [Lachnospiraceae bacterium]